MPTNEHVIEQALDRIVAGYVFPEKAAVVDAAIRSRLAAGAYEALDGPELCETVTAHLQEVCPDKHLRLLWTDEPQSLDPVDEDGGRAAFLALLRAENQGVRRVERLEGNIGLIELRRIATAEEGASVIGAAMQLVAHSSALVLDLRACLGGSPEGAAMWCSYFFPDDQVHLNDIYDRTTDTTRQYWTTAHLPGPRYTDRPVYVLTGEVTFSGGEDVAYTLQAHGRAVVVLSLIHIPSDGPPRGRRARSRDRAHGPDHQPRHRWQLGGSGSHPRCAGPRGPGARHGAQGRTAAYGGAAPHRSFGALRPRRRGRPAVGPAPRPVRGDRRPGRPRGREAPRRRPGNREVSVPPR